MLKKSKEIIQWTNYLLEEKHRTSFHRRLDEKKKANYLNGKINAKR